MYRYFFWDFDGTLFDSYPVLLKAMAGILAERGFHPDSRELETRLRSSIKDTIQWASDSHGLSPSQLGTAFTVRHLELEEQGIPLMEGAADICRAVAAAGGQNFLYTHRDVSALRTLASKELLSLFTDWVTAEDGFPRKPAPDALLHLLNKHGLEPSRSVMVGDRLIDVQAAAHAGIDGILLGGSATGAFRRIQNLRELLPLVKA